MPGEFFEKSFDVMDVAAKKRKYSTVPLLKENMRKKGSNSLV